MSSPKCYTCKRRPVWTKDGQCKICGNVLPPEFELGPSKLKRALALGLATIGQFDDYLRYVAEGAEEAEALQWVKDGRRPCNDRYTPPLSREARLARAAARRARE